MTQLELHDDDVVSIKAVISAFFDAINAADTNALGALFFEQAHLVILRQDPPMFPPSATSDLSPEGAAGSKGDDTLTTVIRTSIEKFIALLDEGKKRREGHAGPVLHEQPDLAATDVRVDGRFGMAWSPFRVTFDGTLHHYGTIVYTLGKAGNKGSSPKEWMIEGLTQSYRRTPGWEASRDFKI